MVPNMGMKQRHIASSLPEDESNRQANWQGSVHRHSVHPFSIQTNLYLKTGRDKLHTNETQIQRSLRINKQLVTSIQYTHHKLWFGCGIEKHSDR